MGKTSGDSLEHRLPDGSVAVIRPVCPEDKPLFVRATREFSPETMAKRFFALKPSFSDAELKYLTEVDGWDHFALVAVKKEATGHWQGIGAARFIRDRKDPETAEFAVIVGDSWQKCGLGTAMLMFLIQAAKRRCVKRLKGDILAENVAAFHLIDRVAPKAQWLTNGVIAMVEFELH